MTVDGDAKPPHLLIVGGGREIPALARAACPGLRTSVFCRMEVLPRVRDIPLNERLVVFRDGATVDEWVRTAVAVHAIDPIDRIATYSEKDQDKAAAVGVALGLRTHGADTIRWVHDKVAMRQRLVECGVDDTPAIRVGSVEQAYEAVDRLGLPVICKPVRGVASKGVSRVERRSDLPAALAFLRQAAADLDSVDALVEPLHRGQELSVECFSEDGEHVLAAVTRKYSEPDHFIEVGHAVPADLGAQVTNLIQATVFAALDALGISEGVTHTEVIVTDTAVRIIETHLRPAGDEIPYLLAEARGVDLIDALARQSVGEPMMPAVRSALAAARDRRTHAAIWYVSPSSAGTVMDVKGVEPARDQPGVTDVEILREPGQEINPVNGSSARVAHVRATGASATEAVDRARSAASLIAVVVQGEDLAEPAVTHG